MLQRLLALPTLLGAFSGASAQNPDLALLFSFRRSTYEFNQPPNVVRAGSYGAALGFIPAFQLKENGPHRFLVEIPLLSAGGVSGSVSASLVQTRGRVSFFSAGPRYQYSFSSRWCGYAGVNFGVGWYRISTVSPALIGSRTEAKPALGLVVGADFRHCKLISLRGEMRQYTLLGTTAGRRSEFGPALGVAVHF